MADAGSSAMRPERASARLVERAESALPPLLRTLAGDPLGAVLKLPDDVDLLCARLVYRAFRDHSSPALKKCIVDFLRTRALAVFAWEHMSGFLIASVEPWLSKLSLAASVSCVGVLEELVDNRQCGVLITLACAFSARKGHLDALTWLRSRNCPWDRNTCHWAAFGGHVEVLRYQHEHGCSWDSNTCSKAAKGGTSRYCGTHTSTVARRTSKAVLLWR